MGLHAVFVRDPTGLLRFGVAAGALGTAAILYIIIIIYSGIAAPMCSRAGDRGTRPAAQFCGGRANMVKKSNIILEKV